MLSGPSFLAAVVPDMVFFLVALGLVLLNMRFYRIYSRTRLVPRHEKPGSKSVLKSVQQTIWPRIRSDMNDTLKTTICLQYVAMVLLALAIANLIV